jgi:hypothetical protein
MGIDKLQEFFFWCMLVNIGVYLFTAIALLVLRDLVSKILTKIFSLDEETIRRSMQMYLAAYKLLITVFNFAPWIAILIIK